MHIIGQYLIADPIIGAALDLSFTIFLTTGILFLLTVIFILTVIFLLHVVYLLLTLIRLISTDSDKTRALLEHIPHAHALH